MTFPYFYHMNRILFTLMIFLSLSATTQVVYEDINNTGIYDFLEELANLKIITINDMVKPWSREYIAGKLFETVGRYEKLNKRQQKELEFYLQDYQMELTKSNIAEWRHTKDSLMVYDWRLRFISRKKPEFAVALNPLSFSYRDALFRFSLRPIIGVRYMINENGNVYHRYWGASGFMYIGRYFGAYGSLRDNYITDILVQPKFFSLETGGVYKENEGGRKGADFSEMRGGIMVGWKWGSFGLMKDFFTWGTSYHGSNIFTAHAPSYPYIQLHLNPVKWFDFNYIHGWLVSKVIDSSRTHTIDGVTRIIYYHKYLAANVFTFIPWRGLNISFGNSVVYSDDNIQPAFLIPFMFFKSVDQSFYDTDNAASNAQMFIEVSSRNIKFLHLYVTLFIDELKMSRILDPEKQNFFSWKFGFRLCDFPVANLSLTAEYTRTQPMTYQHYIPTTTFASDQYNFGHYLRDNAQELYVALGWKPIRGLNISASWTYAEKGDDIPYEYKQGFDVTTIPMLQNIIWSNNQINFTARYELVSNCYLYLEYQRAQHSGDVIYNPEFLHGGTNTLIAGINLGF